MKIIVHFNISMIFLTHPFGKKMSLSSLLVCARKLCFRDLPPWEVLFPKSQSPIEADETSLTYSAKSYSETSLNYLYVFEGLCGHEIQYIWSGEVPREQIVLQRAAHSPQLNPEIKVTMTPVQAEVWMQQRCWQKGPPALNAGALRSQQLYHTIPFW